MRSCLCRGVVVQHIDIPSGNDPDHRVISSRLSQVKMVMMIIDYGDDGGDGDGDQGLTVDTEC